MRARAIVREIADTLATATIPEEDLAGVALFWAYAAGIWNELSPAYDVAIDRLVDRVGREYSSQRLYGGLAGDGWVIAHVSSDASELLAMIDEALLSAVAVERWERLYDLSSGLCGIAKYFLERRRTGAATDEALAHITRHLAASCERDALGCRWRTPPELLSDDERSVAPAGRIDLGLASGNAGAIAVLAEIATPDANALLAKATRWMWMQQLPPHPYARFPSSRAGKTLIEPMRTAWCESDLGIAIALWSAARVLDRSTAAPRELLREIAMRSPAHCRIVDGSLCHGALGLAHVLDRYALGDPMFMRAAAAWYKRALELPLPDSTSFLEGLPGIGLAWMATFDGAELGWDRLLGCEVG